MTPRVLLTAGYARAQHVLALAQTLDRAGSPPAGILVVSPLSPQRVRQAVRNKGAGAILAYLGVRRPAPQRRVSPMTGLLRRLGMRERSLRGWARKHAVPYRTCRNLHGHRAIAFLRAVRPDVVAYGGGGILREPFFEAFTGPVLNAHSGPLPEVRGMNACEWSLLLGRAPEVTIHLIDRGIDTGPVLTRIAVATAPQDTLDDLRQKCVVAGIGPLARHALTPVPELRVRAVSPQGPVTRQCFVLAPALRAALVKNLPTILERRARDASA